MADASSKKDAIPSHGPSVAPRSRIGAAPSPSVGPHPRPIAPRPPLTAAHSRPTTAQPRSMAAQSGPTATHSRTITALAQASAASGETLSQSQSLTPRDATILDLQSKLQHAIAEADGLKNYQNFQYTQVAALTAQGQAAAQANHHLLTQLQSGSEHTKRLADEVSALQQKVHPLEAALARERNGRLSAEAKLRALQAEVDEHMAICGLDGSSGEEKKGEYGMGDGLKEPEAEEDNDEGEGGSCDDSDEPIAHNKRKRL